MVGVVLVLEHDARQPLQGPFGNPHHNLLCSLFVDSVNEDLYEGENFSCYLDAHRLWDHHILVWDDDDALVILLSL